MAVSLAAVLVFSSASGRLLLVAHLLISVFTLGAVTHHWRMLLHRVVPEARLAMYARWMAVAYPLSWLTGVLIYPSYNVLIRKPPIGVLDNLARWAVGLFEIKEHVGSIALAMLPWLVLSAVQYGRLSRIERFSYLAASWVFTLFVYYVFITGGLVTMVKSF
jgi:hypothetical protein